MDRILNKGLQDQIQRLALQDFRLCFDFVIKIPVMQHALNFQIGTGITQLSLYL